MHNGSFTWLFNSTDFCNLYLSDFATESSGKLPEFEGIKRLFWKGCLWVSSRCGIQEEEGGSAIG